MNLIRPVAVVAGTFTTLLLAAGPASAHFCYFDDPNQNAQAGRAGSSGFVSFEDIARGEGICDAGIAVLTNALGISADTLINAHGVMAGPTGGNKAIRTLDFDVLFATLPDAEAACS